MDIKEKVRQVPFGNSVFQIQHFIADQETPERKYRNVLLQWDSKMKAMKECQFRRKRKEIDIAEIEYKLEKGQLSEFDRKRLEIDLEEAEYGLEEEIKLIEDCIIEIKTYEDIISNLPEFTRAEFEKSERQYWKMRLIGDAEREIASTGVIGIGTLASLEKIGCPMGRRLIKDESGKEATRWVILEDKDPLEELPCGTGNFEVQ